MKRLALLIFVVVGISFWGCKPKQLVLPPEQVLVEVPQPIETPIDTQIVVDTFPPVLIASISKTPCYGRCPVFKLEFFENGVAHYIGKRFTDMQGSYEAKVGSDFGEQLKKMVNNSQFFNLSAEFPVKGEPIYDLPNTITFINLEGQEHQIINNHDAPAALLELEKFLTDQVNQLDWEKLEEED